MIFHSDHRQAAVNLVYIQLWEGFTAAIHFNCKTNTILERFVQTPPHLDLCITNTSVFDQANVFLEDLSNNGIYAILSWGTMKSIVSNLAKNSPDHRNYIATHIRELPEGEFVTLYWIRSLFGDHLVGWEDAVKTPPRMTALNAFINSASGLLEFDPESSHFESNHPTVQKLLATISGENKESYIRPEPQELAEGFVQVFVELENTHPMSYIYVEKFTFLAVRSKCKDWWKEEIEGALQILHLGSSIDGMEKWDLTFIVTHSKRKIVVTSSFFVAFAPNIPRKATPSDWIAVSTRIHHIDSLLALYGLFVKAEVHTEDYVKPFREQLVAYRMSYDFGANDSKHKYKHTSVPDTDNNWKDSYQNMAARRTMPKGHLMGPMANSITVSSNMGDGMETYCHYYLQMKLGKYKFRNLLKHCGMLRHPNQTVWPSDPIWKCPGPPASPNIPAEPCNNADPQSNDTQNAIMVGKIVGSDVSPYHGYWLCQKCSRKIGRRDLDVFKTQKETEPLPNCQIDRLEELENQTSNQTLKARRDKRKIEIGEEKVLGQARNMIRANPASETEQTNKAARNQVRDQNRPDKPSGEIRAIRNKSADIDYPERP